MNAMETTSTARAFTKCNLKFSAFYTLRLLSIYWTNICLILWSCKLQSCRGCWYCISLKFYSCLSSSAACALFLNFRASAGYIKSIHFLISDNTFPRLVEDSMLFEAHFICMVERQLSAAGQTHRYIMVCVICLTINKKITDVTDLLNTISYRIHETSMMRAE